MRGSLLLALLLTLPGCVGNVYAGPDLRALGAELTVHFEEGRCPVDLATAERTGLTDAAAEAIARIPGVQQRAFMPGQIEAILNESRYLHVAFPGNATIEMPADDAVDERRFSNLYLIWETSARTDDVLSDTGQYGTTYPMAELAERAREASREACGAR